MYKRQISICCLRLLNATAGDVASAPLTHNLWNGLTTGKLEGGDKLKHGSSITSAQVDRLVAHERVSFSCLNRQRCCVTLGQVSDMDEVTNTSAIRSWIVGAEYTQLRQMSTSDSLDIWHQVVRDTLWILSDETRAMGTDGVEITKANCREVTIFRRDSILQELFYHGLGLTVWVSRADIHVLLALWLVGTVQSG